MNSLLPLLTKIAICCACLWVLAKAAQVQPDARGFGTHESLGIEPCSYLRATGEPCISCGMTTAFAHTIRFQWWRAFLASPAGLLLCLLAILTPGYLIHSQIFAVPALRIFAGRRLYWILPISAVILGASWLFKIQSFAAN